MCLAIYKPAGKVVPEEHLEEGFTSNPDGAGYAYIADDGKVHYAKGFFRYEDFIKHYNRYVKPEHEAVIHFRWATVGAKNTDNCHPFLAGNGGVLVHNGPQIQNLGNSEVSDSREFAEKIIARFNKETIESMKDVLEGYLGFNKAAVLYPTGVVLLNEKLGVWDDGIWYSNDGYKMYYSSYDWKNWKNWKTGNTTTTELEEPPLYRDADGEYELTDDYLAYLLSQADDDMRDYIDKHVDLDNYFFDEEADTFFFYDELLADYIHLSEGWTVEEYYTRVLGYHFYPGADDTDNDPTALWPDAASANRAVLREFNH